MDIKLRLNKNFVACWNRLAKKYGEKFERMNGFHQSNLNFNDFIDNFIDSQNVADVTIDANANSNTKDIRTLIADMTKPHTKLLSYNKIFYEITKKYGLATAELWLEEEWSGALYLHDAPSSSMYPYCIMPSETCYYVYQGKLLHGNFNDIYNMLPEEEVYLPEINTYAKYPKGLRVQDKKGWTNVKRICWHKNTDKKMHFIKTKNGQSIITTEDHVFFNANGEEIQAKNINKSEKLDVTFDKNLFTNSITKWHCRELDYDLGWFIGFIIAEGTIPKKGSMISISQSTKSISDIERFLSICDNKGIKYRTYDYQEGVIKINVCAGSQQNSCPEKYNWRQFIASIIKGNYAHEKHLTPEYINFNNDFLLGIISGLFDGDGTVIANSTFSLRISSRTMINQVLAILLANNIMVSNRKPYIQEYERDTLIKQTKPSYGVQVNMNLYPDFFANSVSRKVKEKWINKLYNIKMANKTFSQNLEDTETMLNDVTFDQDVVFDLTTESGSFVCNNIRVHNCYAYDLDKVVDNGLFFVNRFKTESPKHLTTFNDHVLEFISWVSNRTSGACGLPSYLVYSYYFWYNDIKNNFYLKNPEYYRRQCFQKFIYDLNQPYLRITECAFTNISIMDRNYLAELFGDRKYPDGEYVIDHIEGIIEHQKVFMETISEIRSKMMFTFPVLTYSLLFQNGKFVDEDFAKWCNKHNMQWYDSNFYVGNDVTSLSNCCRLISDTSKLNAFINSIGGTSLSIGSIKVNTINLRRISLESNNNEDKFIEILKQRIDTCVKTLDIIRHIISRNIEKGLLPNYEYGLIDMEKQYNTIGITAMYEALNDFGYINTDEFGNKSYSDKALSFAKIILDTINQQKDSYGFKYSINVECIPAERANVILCNKDQELYSEKVNEFIYSNQWIPLTENCKLQEKIRLGSILDKECGGGQISHINIQAPFSNEQQSWELLNQISNAGVIYFAYNIKISVCENEHGFIGNICPTCGKEKVDSYQRIVGYLVASSSYSKERKKEFEERKWFKLD